MQGSNKGYAAVAEGPKAPAMLRCIVSVLLTVAAAAGTAARHLPFLQSCCKRRRNNNSSSSSSWAAAANAAAADIEGGVPPPRELQGTSKSAQKMVLVSFFGSEEFAAEGKGPRCGALQHRAGPQLLCWMSALGGEDGPEIEKGDVVCAFAGESLRYLGMLREKGYKPLIASRSII
ncbi:hypothetical protein, conserved [Eimeria tenella]|uniref:Uncharacterized protein n=1 Tax=Eimeria tenella TaxID=5802 RepID=U6KYG9_EIMTE|nr:hypothetical protein, conserved [Eimeria tenella]CDJ41953.1 hypothetical protein, conserved [Eimeria tenella]|eukprot:XP_013232703.1 hypothetical protein, conserved [Eimeria tenella]